MARPRSRREARQFWTAKIAEYKSSELSQRAFCETHELRQGTFQNWLYRLRAEEREQSVETCQEQTEARAFLEVITAPVQEAPSQSCVVRLGGAEVEFSSRPEPAYLVELLATLGVVSR